MGENGVEYRTVSIVRQDTGEGAIVRDDSEDIHERAWFVYSRQSLRAQIGVASSLRETEGAPQHRLITIPVRFNPMKFFVGVTDGEWFSFLSARNPTDINFWQPGGGPFKALKPGEPFLFKLHSPNNVIAGGGFFLRHELMPMSMAWEVFRENNGVPDYATFASKIIGYQKRKKEEEPSLDMDPSIVARVDSDPAIGCIILASPFFWPAGRWIPQPADWKSQIVRGKGYTAAEPIGAGIWEMVQRQLLTEQPTGQSAPATSSAVIADRPAFGAEYLTRARLGQDMFRMAVIEAYGRRCAMSGEKTLPVLQASHIKPYGLSQSHRISNGLLLRADLHILFDRGLITVTPDYAIQVSPAIREKYQGGEGYYPLHHRRLLLPGAIDERPDRAMLEWHNHEVYVGR